jgi:hypothetical protein
MFKQLPDECATIGRILTGYGELEVHLGLCLGAVAGDFRRGLKVIYGGRGEAKRIIRAKKKLWPVCWSSGLEAELEQAIDAMDYCRQIRNNFSHCQWAYAAGHGAFFGNLETGAKDVGAVYRLDLFHVDLPILDALEGYMTKTRDSLSHLEGAILLKFNKRSTNPFDRVPDFPKPPMHNPPEKHPAPPGLAPEFNK